jgi:hypothetical protein
MSLSHVMWVFLLSRETENWNCHALSEPLYGPLNGQGAKHGTLKGPGWLNELGSWIT